MGIGHVLTLKTLALARQAGKGPIQIEDVGYKQAISLPPLDYSECRDESFIKFAWSGDTAGQGYGTDATRGGMTTFDAIRKHAPDFFVNSGDICYADNPITSEVRLDDGSTWKNLASQATWKVICCDLPIGLLVRDGAVDFENGANGDGPALGRELKIAQLLSFMKRKQI